MSTIKPLRRRAGLAAAAALATAAAGLLLSAPAQALPPGVDPANRIGDLYLDVYSGTVATLGGPQQLTTTVGCPEHYRGSSRVYLVWADGTTDPNRFPAVVYIDDLAGAGLDGQPIDRQGVYASRWVTAAFPKSIFTDHTETATYLVTCDPGDAPDGENYPLAGEGIGSSKYFSIEMDFVWGDGSNPTWSAVEPAAAEYDSSESDINVDIPTLTTPPGPATGLKISVKPGATTLTGPN
ncbi:MAG: hypothetical protein LBC97_14380, partial [Bifidobacteriaceae bacterium]|nr:hypothetical protein [Bifidobacteriaceae bacterium]